MNAKKDYTLAVEEHDSYVYAIAGGDKLTAQISAAYWNEIAEKCFEIECKKILIEKDFIDGVGPTEMLMMADHLGSLLPGWRIAFVDRYGHDDINELGKKLARNRDVMMQIFENTSDAEKWLLAN